jgi:hypothetical protein
METLIFVLGALCGTVLLGIAYLLRELLMAKSEIKSLRKNKYAYEDRFGKIEEEISNGISSWEIKLQKLHEELKDRHSHLHSRIEEAKNKSWVDSDKMYQDLHRRIDKEILDIRSSMDSRLNKMENKFIKIDLLHPASDQSIESKR